MGITQRLILAASILAVDVLLFFVPLSAIFLAYILIGNPPWFREFLERSTVPPA